MEAVRETEEFQYVTIYGTEYKIIQTLESPRNVDSIMSCFRSMTVIGPREGQYHLRLWFHGVYTLDKARWDGTTTQIARGNHSSLNIISKEDPHADHEARAKKIIEIPAGPVQAKKYPIGTKYTVEGHRTKRENGTFEIVNCWEHKRGDLTFEWRRINKNGTYSKSKSGWGLTRFSHLEKFATV